jgi:hypothetical protein
MKFTRSYLNSAVLTDISVSLASFCCRMKYWLGITCNFAYRDLVTGPIKSLLKLFMGFLSPSN